MFDNVGGKIKGIAKFCFGFFVSICIICAIFMFAILEKVDAPEIVGLIAFLLIAVGPVLAYLISLLIVGFGELIETNDIIAYGHTKKANNESVSTAAQSNVMVVKCDMCNVSSSSVAPAKYIDGNGDIQYRKVCPECAKKYNCTII